ncbi:hypothetical protein LIER_01898 [Lithospermum erythrorhizon]|uniref:Uncharacterized protein n=1 Tax=Lithospermum erythrorhizon TaxID=34254 RepID=A0AAV3NNV6_LITER
MANKNLLLKQKEDDLASNGSELEGLAKTVAERDIRIKDLLAKLEREKVVSVEARNQDVGSLRGAGTILKTTEVVQKEKEITLASAAEAKVARIAYAKKTIQDFLTSPNYATKVGPECAAYLTHVITHYKARIPELASIFVAERQSFLVWFECLSLDPPSEEAENVEEWAEDVELTGDEEDAELLGKSRSPPS